MENPDAKDPREHPYFKAYQKMREKEARSFGVAQQTLLTLICWDIQLAWFKIKTRSSERDFIKQFGMEPLLC